MILETKRLYLREMTREDYPVLCTMLQDKEVMHAWEHAFSDDEAHAWLDKQLDRYREYGFGLWAVVLKETDEMIGQCGVTVQEYRREGVLEVGYIFRKEYWHNGYATEAARACKNYAFEKLGADEVYSFIRDNNQSSQRVAVENGMTVKDTIQKHYYGMYMPHFVFSVRKENEK